MTSATGLRIKKSKKSFALTKADQKLLRSFRIPEKLIAAAGIYRVDDRGARAKGFKFATGKDLSGIVFPYRDADRSDFNARLRRDHPEIDEHGKEIDKCISMPSGTRRGLYWPPTSLELLDKHPTWEIVPVEAEKSALAGTAAAARAGRNYIFVAIGGCQGWKDKNNGVLPDLDRLRGRAVALMLDSNIAQNSEVKAAELELAEYLSSIDARVRCLRVPTGLSGVNGPDDYLAKKGDADFWKLFDNPVEPWLDLVGETYEKYLAAKPPEFVIKDFLQSGGAMLIGGLSGHGKTFVLLSMVQSLLTGNKLFGHFDIRTKAERVIYLTPEITLPPFKLRAEKFGLGPFIKNRQLIFRTLSAYPMIELTDPALLLSARGADVFLDTIVRFGEGDENSSGDNDRGLAAGIFRLLQSGARSVIGAAHSPKGFENADYMSLENVLRGSGDIGAMLSAAWGVRLLDRDRTLVHVENIKARDFTPPPPFQLCGIPSINEGKGFQMYLEPGECKSLSTYKKESLGRKKDPRRAERITLIEQLLKEKKTKEEIAEAVRTGGWAIAASTLTKEIREAKPKKF